MRRTLQSALLLGLSSLAAAVFEDEVGDIDFHYSLVGLPQVETTFFHRPRKEDKASLLYTLSDVGVLGAVNPSNGELVWRHQIADDVTSGGYLRAPEGENWVAAAHGSRVQAWNALTGRNVWQMEFTGEVRDLEIMELTETARKDVLALFDEDGVTVLRRLHGGLGTVVWEFREHSKDVPLQVSNNIANIYVASLHGSGASYNLRVTSLDTATGARVDHWSVGAKGDIHGPKDVMFVGANSAAPIAAWANSGLAKLSVNMLGSKSKQDFHLPPDAASVQIHAPHLAQSQPHFLVHIQTKPDDKGEKNNKAIVFHTDLKTGQSTIAYELPYFRGEGAFSTSSDGANVYFTQTSSEETLIVSSDSHGILARWPIEKGANVNPAHAVSEVVKKPGGQDFAVRSAVVTNSDDWTLIRNGAQDWTRHEGLSGAVAAVWAEIPEGEDLAKVLAEEAHTNPLSACIHRVTRHIEDLQYLPGYLASIPGNVVNSIAGGEMVGKKEGLHRDNFGFNKILVIATRRGRFYGLDSGNNGKIIWTQSWFPRDASNPLVIKGLISDDEDGIVVAYGAGGEYAAFNASTGAARGVHGANGDKPRVASAAVVDSESSKVLLPIGPDGLPTRGLPAGWDSDQTIVVRGEGEVLKGVKFDTEGGKVVKQDMWQLQVRPGQKIVEIAAPSSHNPIASIGRVLGDRRVMYKYLNANSIVVAVADEAAKTLSVQLVDTVSGQMLASQQYGGVDSTKSVSCTTAENWYACSFFGDYTLDDNKERSIKGYQVVVSDLYESPEPNSRGPLGEAANFSSLNPVDSPTGVPLPWVVSQAYVISQPLTTLSVTQTLQGISTRELVAYLPQARGILGLSRHAIDPRRPVGRDPTAAEMKAEMLMKYSPALEIDPRNILSHERDVLGVKGIVATAAVVESTSLLVAYGVDVYSTRVAPSGVFDILGKGFNKTTLVGTVLALFVGVMSLAPMVRLVSS
ncbi:ER membrane protein complex subunit 1 [Tolypocladium ophioglossoides CBS 100239]|uniref:ER membrane protein complex subunit 1 n=1 Tax=Tolypocladium ophioglossoides (strain CBS 100239) TaxID=1163406 RepID=A0A0L0N5B8_TOLOC|nr:ER membrane protein complex subunit 1 [Tolypocladium ophioglossoides CBS 100239]